MAKRADITAAQLCAILDYNPDTGEFRWKARTPEMFDDGIYSAKRICETWNSKLSGKPAGYLSNGYVEIAIFRVRFKAHRIAWAIMTGRWPENEIDHINCVRTDNSWSNLRQATRAQNAANTRAPSNNTSGSKGVSWFKRHRKWRAYITVNDKQCHLGYFDAIEDARTAYRVAAEKLRGEFARID